MLLAETVPGEKRAVREVYREAMRLMSKATTLTREAYLSLKAKGLTDKAIFKQHNITAGIAFKRRWGLVGVSLRGRRGKEKLQQAQEQAQEQEQKQEPVSSRPVPRTEEECFKNPVLAVNIQSGQVLTNRLWSWV